MMRTRLISIAALTLFAVAGHSASAQQVSYVSGTYTENFDSLATTGTTNAWANGTTLTGWHSVFGPASIGNTTRDASTTNTSVYIGDSGTGTGATTGGRHSYGVAGVNALTERALGSIGSGSQESAFALVIRNDGAFALDTFTLTYDGEQWRNGQPVPGASHALVFDYTVLVALPTIADLDAANVAAYTAVPALNFTGPIASGTAAGALDGNDAPNRVAGITSTITATIPVGSYLVLRWWDNNDPSNDHGLAIDNLSFSATPAPGALALLGVGGLALARRRRA